MNNSTTSVLILAFNRPLHLEECLVSLGNQKELDEVNLLIHVDGARNSREDKKTREVIEVASRFIEKFKGRLIVESSNLGLQDSVLNTIDHIFEFSEQVVVIEDDLVIGKHFLNFCLDGLSRYFNDKRVASIHGFSHPLNVDENYFLQGADCWGWATWKDRWNDFERDSAKLYRELKDRKLNWEFDLNGTFQYTKMLERHVNGNLNSWAIRWHASMFLQERLTLYPWKSLVMNNGIDGSGTNMKKAYKRNHSATEMEISAETSVVEESKEAKKELIKYYKQIYAHDLRSKASLLKRQIAHYLEH